MPSVNQSPGGCNCPSAGCSVTITGTVTGCAGAAAAGVTVAAHDSTSGGAVIGTATTNSSGVYSISIASATTGHNIVVVPSLGSRFVATSSTLAYTTGTADSTHWKCGATSSGVNFGLAAAAGYKCLAGCAIPLATTLHFTHSFFGSGTLTWVGADQWLGSVAYSYPGCHAGPFSCAAQTVHIGVCLGVSCGFAGVSYGNSGGCPDDLGLTGTFTESSSSASLTCYPFNYVLNYPAGRGPASMYCGVGPGADTLTITE